METESEFGVPIPGRILPEAEWARTGIKRLPPPGRSTGRRSSGGSRHRAGNRVWQRAIHPPQRPESARDRPLRHRPPPRRHPLCDPTGQPAGPPQRTVRRQGRRVVPRPVCARRVGRRGPPLSSPAVPRPEAGPPAARDAPVPRRRPPRARPRRAVRRPDGQPRLLGLHPRAPPRLLRLRGTPRALARRPRGAIRREILARSRGLRIFRGVGAPPGPDSAATRPSPWTGSLPPPTFGAAGPSATVSRAC